MFAEKSREGFNPDKHQLYSIVTADDQAIPRSFVLQDSNLVMHSTTSGLTGLAIASPGTLIVATAGQSDRRFSQDVDNYLNIGDIHEVVVGAMVDGTGQTRGVIQLINKEETESKRITEEERLDIQGVLPALGEILRCADESSELSQICCCTNFPLIICIALHRCMDSMLAHVRDDYKGMERAHVDL